MRDETTEAWGGLIVIILFIITALSTHAYFDPYVTICQGDTEEYSGLFVTVNSVDPLQRNTVTFTVGTSGSENTEFQDKEIGFYDEISGTKRYGIRLLHIGFWSPSCVDFHITTDFPIPK